MTFLIPTARPNPSGMAMFGSLLLVLYPLTLFQINDYVKKTGSVIMKAIVLVVAATCLVMSEVKANTFTETQTLGPFDDYYGERFETLPAFDASLGTLNSISYSTTVQLSEVVRVAPEDATLPASANFNTHFEVRFANAGGQTFTAPTQVVGTYLTADGRGTVRAILKGAATFLAASYLYLNEPLDFRLAAFATPTTDSRVYFPDDSSSYVYATGTMAVTFDYTPFAVPEPASLTMLGLSLASIVGMKRRRSA